MNCRLIVIALVLIMTSLHPQSYASISPQEVVVVYNSHSSWNTGDKQSKAVADYYCASRDIPTANEVGIDWDGTTESIGPSAFNDSRCFGISGARGPRGCCIASATFLKSRNNNGTKAILRERG